MYHRAKLNDGINRASGRISGEEIPRVSAQEVCRSPESAGGYDTGVVDSARLVQSLLLPFAQAA
jgi:hypothetical protein